MAAAGGAPRTRMPAARATAHAAAGMVD